MSESDFEIQGKWNILGWEGPKGIFLFFHHYFNHWSLVIKICSKLFWRGEGEAGEASFFFFLIVSLNSLLILILPQQKINNSWELEEGKEGKKNAWGFFLGRTFSSNSNIQHSYSNVVLK